MMLCKRCNIEKELSDFYFDKSRNKIRTPCKKCSAKTKRIKRPYYDWTNNFIKVKRHLEKRLKIYNPSDLFVYFYISHLKLKREISKQNTVILKENILICQKCSQVYQLKDNSTIDNLINTLNEIKEAHNKCTS